MIRWRRGCAVMCVAAFALMGSACAAADVFTPGAYTAQAPGFGGPVEVEIEVDTSKILSVKVPSHSETQGIGTVAIDALTGQIVEQQSIGLDVIAGCTVTSEAVLAAAGAALEKSGADMEALRERRDSAQALKRVLPDAVDVVVVGAGGAGMSAAIRSKQLGADVVVVEKRGMVGGNTNFVGTGIGAAGAKVQVEAGTFTEPDELYKLIMGSAPEQVMEGLEGFMRKLADRSGAKADQLVEMGIDLTRPLGGGMIGMADGSSPGGLIVGALNEQMGAMGIECYLQARAVSLQTEDGAVTGVQVEMDGEIHTIAAKSVILATGGFGADAQLLGEFAPKWADAPTPNTSETTGDGMKMAREIGAQLSNMDRVGLNPTLHVHEGVTVFMNQARTKGGIFVNLEGKRFVNEQLASLEEISAIMRAQTDGKAYVIIDQTIRDAVPALDAMCSAGFFIEAADEAALARATGLDAGELSRTLEGYRSSFDAGKDEAFGRAKMASRLDRPAYYAAIIEPGPLTAIGGIRVDENACVLDTEGKVIPGLFAAGEVTDQGTREASPLCVALVYGDVAAESAVENCQ